MGKSEFGRLPVTKQNGIGFMEPDATKVNGEMKKTVLPPGIELLRNQVAGHTEDGKGNSLGMMQCTGTVLKPITKPACGEREIAFYEELEITRDETLLELKQFVPKYYGTRMVTINGNEVECIELEDLTRHYKEPCIMDIKIGRRTWDPTASYEKIINEDKKYQECKRDLGFCIPGFQVYKLSNNRLLKYGKDFGKRLNKDSIVSAIKTFLNADLGLCRTLLIQILTNLWRILHWSRNQRRLRLYSSSILLIYDARRLREYFKNIENEVALPSPRPDLLRSRSLYRPMSLAVLNKADDNLPTGFSGQLTTDGPILHIQRSPTRIKEFVDGMPAAAYKTKADHPWRQTIRSLKRTHSFHNNYDKDVESKKQDYTLILDDLITEKKSEIWATVKMIDFAHVFPAENLDIDSNYLNGIENLVKLFEDLLMETDSC